MATVDQVDLQDITEAAENAGLAPHSVEIIESVYFAICSGDVPLPWDQGMVENVLSQWDAIGIIDLLMEHPEFIQVALDYHNLHG